MLIQSVSASFEKIFRFLSVSKVFVYGPFILKVV